MTSRETGAVNSVVVLSGGHGRRIMRQTKLNVLRSTCLSLIRLGPWPCFLPGGSRWLRWLCDSYDAGAGDGRGAEPSRWGSWESRKPPPKGSTAAPWPGCLSFEHCSYKQRELALRFVSFVSLSLSAEALLLLGSGLVTWAQGEVPSRRSGLLWR